MTTKRAILVHGFNVTDGGAGSIDTLSNLLAAMNMRVKQFDYGWLFIFGVLFKNKKIAKELKAIVKPGDVGIGHSNGCALLLKAAVGGAPFKTLIFINPALESDALIPDHVEQVLVFYTHGDKAVKAAKWARISIGWLFRGFQWGEMGAVGYTGKDDDNRVTNINLDKYSHSHSGIFATAVSRNWLVNKCHFFGAL